MLFRYETLVLVSQTQLPMGKCRSTLEITRFPRFLQGSIVHLCSGFFEQCRVSPRTVKNYGLDTINATGLESLVNISSVIDTNQHWVRVRVCASYRRRWFVQRTTGSIFVCGMVGSLPYENFA